MALHTFTHSSAPLRRVKTIQFGILSPEEIKGMSVAKIEFPETFEEGNQRPKVGGLSDSRLGTIDRNFKCETCGENITDCPGHFGHIELAKGVYHVGFLNKVKKILESVCTNCGKLKADPRTEPRIADAMRYIRDPKKRLAFVHDICKSIKVCQADAPDNPDEPPQLDEDGQPVQKAQHGGCGHMQPNIRKEGLKLSLVTQRKTDEEGEDTGAKATKVEDRKNLPATAALMILKKIPDEDLQIMGLSVDEARPEWMILTVLPVPPMAVRPSVAVDGGAMRSEDDLTYKLADIIKANQNVRRLEQEGAPAHVVDEFETLLQYHIATYMDNDLPGQPQSLQKSGRPVKSIRARLKGKEGRLRGNLMGKRVDFSARTVITGDPNLDLDQVGVPYSIARNLTYPERVTPYNITYLQELVKNGPNEYPGAKYVIRDTGDRIDLRYNKTASGFLQYGWIVERHLKDDDLVLFNRQPSLHKMSMMAHRVKLMPYSTFRLNLSVTSPYNADFDGDEMNLHVPQSEETRAELSQIAWVPRQIVSPQSNKPVMGIVQDTLCGVRKMTVRDQFVDRDFMQNILLWVPGWDGILPPPAIIKPKPLWTGKQIFSMIVPKGVNYFRADSNPDPLHAADTGVMIEDGQLMYGVIEKKAVGASSGGIIHILFKERGPELCRDFIGGMQKVINYWLLHHGFSIGIGDTVPDPTTQQNIVDIVGEAKRQVKEVIASAYMDGLEAEPGMTIRESFENKVSNLLNVARDDAGKLAQEKLKDDNNVKQMVIAGSKGSFINIAQMSASVGQQIVEGKRVPYGFKFRTLPHFTKDDYGPESRGFVENSYLRGLTPQEFYFHAMGGREGLIDTAVKTAETGYIQRRLVKALEDVTVAYDGTVRNSLGDIVQFIYGEDGMDGAAVESQTVETLRMSQNKFEQTFRVDMMDPDWAFKKGALQVGLDEGTVELQAVLDEEYDQLWTDRNLLRDFIIKSGDASKALPVNLKRIIQNAQQIFHIDFAKPSDLPPAEIVQTIRELQERLIVIRGKQDRLTVAAQENATLLFRIHLRSIFAAKRVLQEHHLNREAFEWIMGEVEARFNQSVAHPGEMCGVIAAQSIGEPATQMTLNTFHYAGVSSKNVTLGVPRLKEIINVARNIKTPSITVYLKDEFNRSAELAKRIQSVLPHTTLKTITASTEIFYDPNVETTLIEDDRDFVHAFFEIPDPEVEQNIHRQSPWLLRFEIDKRKMVDKEYEMGFVQSKIQAVFEQDLFVIASEDLAEKLVIRCRALQEHEKGGEDDEDAEIPEDVFLKQLESSMLSSITLGGVEGIERAFIVERKRSIIGDNGEYVQVPEWVLETDGSNLRKVLTVDGVDTRRTISNNCVEVLEVLGIEAARQSLLREMRHVIEFGGSSVNYRHLSLLVDLMTNRGSIMAITRHGINRADTGALMRCSFEETVEILMEAAAIGERDHCTGVAENVLLGQLAPMGTGSFDVALDLDMLKDVVVDHRLPAQNVIFGQDGSMTPGGGMTPYAEGDYGGRTPANNYDQLAINAQFSPIVQAGGDEGAGAMYGGYGQSPYTPRGGQSPGYGMSPGFSPSSPGFSPASPAFYAPTSPGFVSSPFAASRGNAGYSPSSPNMGMTSPGFSPSSPNGYSPTSPSFSPSSPAFSPSSPRFSPASPSFSPSSPRFSPASPTFSPASPRFSPASPAYSPTSPRMSPASPAYSPASPQFSPASPAFSPSSPAYTPTSPAYTPNAAGNSPASPAYQTQFSSARSPAYSTGARSPAANGYTANPSWSPKR